MHFTIDQQDSTTIFRLKGSADAPARLDSANAGALKAEFLILAQPDVETLIVDLSEVTYVDSAGLSALLLAERQQSAHGGEVRLSGASESVLSLLRLTQLDRVFSIYPTLQDAMNAEFYPMNDGTTFPNSPEAKDGNASAQSGKRTAALAAGGSLGAAALAAIVLGHEDSEDDAFLALGDEEFDDDDDDLEDDDFDEDELDDDDDLDDVEEDDDLEEDDLEEAPAEADLEEGAVVEDIDPEDLDDDFDDDDDDFEDDDLL